VKVTISTISRLTGVSESTVSRVLSGKAEQFRISKSTIEKVKAEAKRCHYTPNLLAQSLRTRKTFTVGLTVPRIEDPFFSYIASVIINRLKDNGFHTIIADTLDSVTDEREALRLFQGRDVDGIIAVPVGNDPSEMEIINKNVPIVLIDRYYSNTSLPFVVSNNFEGGRIGTEHLINKGYRRILSIKGVPAALSSIERVNGFEAAIAKHLDLKIEKAAIGDAFSIENGYVSTMQAFKSGKNYDAIFTYSSTILLGTLRALRELGYKVPEDVALLSFDGYYSFDYMKPAITRIEQPLFEIGSTAVDTLLKIIEARLKNLPDPKPLQKFLNPELVVRESC
jgi:LacI family transcriptional regulator